MLNVPVGSTNCTLHATYSVPFNTVSLKPKKKKEPRKQFAPRLR